MMYAFPLLHLPDEFNRPEIRALMDDLGLVPMSCFKSSYLWPYIPTYVHTPYPVNTSKSVDEFDLH